MRGMRVRHEALPDDAVVVAWWMPDLDADLDRLLACDTLVQANPHFEPPEAQE